jgi:nucleosome binding factor SPN SPT16 subunit
MIIEKIDKYLAEAKPKIDPDFIKQVAADLGHKKISSADIKRAHQFAAKGDPEDYYYKLKEFFNN